MCNVQGLVITVVRVYLTVVVCNVALLEYPLLVKDHYFDYSHNNVASK